MCVDFILLLVMLFALIKNLKKRKEIKTKANTIKKSCDKCHQISPSEKFIFTQNKIQRVII